MDKNGFKNENYINSTRQQKMNKIVILISDQILPTTYLQKL